MFRIGSAPIFPCVLFLCVCVVYACVYINYTCLLMLVLIRFSIIGIRRFFCYSNSRRTFISDQPYVQKKTNKKQNGSKTEHVRV